MAPGVVAAGGHLQDAAHRMHRKVGLVRVHEFEDGVDVFSPLAANQAVAFLRNTLERLQSEPEVGSAALKLLDNPFSVGRFVVVGTGILVVDPEAHRVVEQHGDLPSRGRHRLGLADPRSQPAVERAERSVRFGRLSPRRAAGAPPRGLLVLRVRDDSTLPPLILQPGDSVSHEVKCLAARPTTQISAALGDQAQREVRTDAVDLGYVRADDLVQQWPRVEVHSVRLLGAMARLGQRLGRCGRLLRKAAQHAVSICRSHCSTWRW